MTIFKYPLSRIDEQNIQIPREAKILHAEMQNRVLCVCGPWWIQPTICVTDVFT